MQNTKTLLNHTAEDRKAQLTAINATATCQISCLGMSNGTIMTMQHKNHPEKTLVLYK